jgi:hypothetical protein
MHETVSDFVSFFTFKTSIGTIYKMRRQNGLGELLQWAGSCQRVKC